MKIEVGVPTILYHTYRDFLKGNITEQLTGWVESYTTQSNGFQYGMFRLDSGGGMDFWVDTQDEKLRHGRFK